MYYRDIFRVLSKYMTLLGSTLLLPIFVCIYYELLLPPSQHLQPHSLNAFLVTLLACLACALLFKILGKGSKGKLFRKECLALVLMFWIFTSIISSLPFLFSGTLSRPTDCLFEAVSGLTTTGATVMEAKSYDSDNKEQDKQIVFTINNQQNTYNYQGTIEPIVDKKNGTLILEGLEAVSKGVLFWRGFTQWLGGMGIVLLFVSILPAFGVGGKVLFQAESTGPVVGEITARVSQTANYLWKIYVGLTFLEVLLLCIFCKKIPVIDTVLISFSSISTGGFCALTDSIAGYQDSVAEWIIMLFMIIGGVNFSLYFFFFRGKFFKILDRELAYYLLFLLVLGGLVAYYNFRDIDYNSSFSNGLRNSFFQLISTQTSTGYVTQDYTRWSTINQFILYISMFIGSMASSTGGGIKIIRHLLLFKILKTKIEAIFHPETVRKVSIGNKSIDQKVEANILSFYALILLLSLLGAFIFVFDGLDVITSFAVNACMINNVGVAFGAASPTSSFAFLPVLSKYTSMLWMLMGRLEFFGLLIILFPSFWKRM